MRFSNHWKNKRVKAPPSSKHWKKKFRTLEPALLLFPLFAVAGSECAVKKVVFPRIHSSKSVQVWHVPKDRPMELGGNDLNLNGVASPSRDSLLFEVEVVKCAN